MSDGGGLVAASLLRECGIKTAATIQRNEVEVRDEPGTLKGSGQGSGVRGQGPGSRGQGSGVRG